MKNAKARKQAKGQKNQEITFPYTHTEYSVSVKIYKTPRGGYDAFTLAYYQDGQRKRVISIRLVRLLQKPKILRGCSVLKMSMCSNSRAADRASYLWAREILDPLNVSLEVAAAQYAHYKTLLPDVPLSTLVDFYRQKGPKGVKLKAAQLGTSRCPTITGGQGLRKMRPQRTQGL